MRDKFEEVLNKASDCIHRWGYPFARLEECYRGESGDKSIWEVRFSNWTGPRCGITVIVEEVNDSLVVDDFNVDRKEEE